MRTRTPAVFVATLALLVLALPTTAPLQATPRQFEKLEARLHGRSDHPGHSRVVVRGSRGAGLSGVPVGSNLLGGRVLRLLPLIDSVVLDVPNEALGALDADDRVARVSLDRPIAAATDPMAVTIGATAVRQQLGYDGSGIGVAVIDSGVFAAHPDLADPASGATRVDDFVDFVNGSATPYDDYGHGTHVSGVIAGSGVESGGARAGVAPGVHLMVLKVLDASGNGHVSDVIAALDYVIAHKDEFGIRIVNLSVAAGVYESYMSDPLTLAAKRAVDAGLVVVAAAGNFGRGPSGIAQYAGITSPGNAPWVLTVGASSDMGTADRGDDTVAAFSSRGPAAIDNGAKPDVLAPGVGVESLAAPGSAFYVSYGAFLLDGSVPSQYKPYLSLSGTSIAAPVVSGSVALMLQANPALTPNLVKAILEYTAQRYSAYDALTQGAGFLNTAGAVRLAASLPGAVSPMPPPPQADTASWSEQIIWRNLLETGGRLTTDATAWAAGVVWGDATIPDGSPVSWGVSGKKPWLAKSNGSDPNVVWRNVCGGKDCSATWTALGVFGANGGEAETVVWGSSQGEGETVVWGSVCPDPGCSPVIWPTP